MITIVYLIGLLICTMSVGTLTSAPVGFIVLGFGLIVYAIVCGLVRLVGPHK